MSPVRLEAFSAPDDEPVIVFHRTFEAPSSLVFDAWTRPEHLRHWRGPLGFELVGCEVDLRVGGGYRFVHRDPDGGRHVFRGRYLEIEPPSRLASTFVLESEPGIEVLDEVRFAQDGATTMAIGRSTFPTFAARDFYLATGARQGLTRCHDQLDELLHALTAET